MNSGMVDKVELLRQALEEETDYLNNKNTLRNGDGQYNHSESKVFVALPTHAPVNIEEIREGLQQYGLRNFSISYEVLTKNENGHPANVLHEVGLQYNDTIDKETVDKVINDKLYEMGYRNITTKCWVSSTDGSRQSFDSIISR